MIRRLLAGLALSIGVASCGGTSPSLPIEYSLPAEEPEADPLSQRVLIIADNQEHFLYGEPIWLRRGLFDKAVGSAIRSPELDLYGKDLLAWILEHAEDNKTIPIHLGDALNVSCTVEMDHFEATMRRSKKPWFLAPGNHDGFFYGSGRMHREWRRACRDGGGPITTAAFIRRYLAALAKQPDAGARAFAGVDLGKHQGSFQYRGAGPAVLRRVEWRTYADDGPFWKSYLLQELDLTVNRSPRPRAVRVILVDTSQFKSEPGVIAQALPGVYDAGSIGSMLDDQFRTLSTWLEENQRDGAETVLMGHHPQAALIEPVRKRLHAVREKYGVQLYVSAHTHSSSYRVLKDGSSTQLELNVGSTLDWPAQYRTFQVSEVSKEGRHRVVMRSPRFDLWRVWQNRTAPDRPKYPNCGAHETEWYPLERERNRYIDYMNDNSALSSVPMQRKIMVALLGAYERLLGVSPTSAAASWPGGATDDASLLARIAQLRQPGASLKEQERLLRELEAFEASRTVEDEALHRDYRLCQALWSSSADRYRRRVPEADQWFVLFPESHDPKAGKN